MTTKPARKSRRNVKDLKVKSLAADQAKRVKGGPNTDPWFKKSSQINPS